MPDKLLLEDATEICIDNLLWDYHSYCDNPTEKTEAKVTPTCSNTDQYPMAG